MAWHNDSKIIGEKVIVKNEKEDGVVTRIDYDRGLVYVLFPKMREVSYPFPASLEQGYLTIRFAKR